MTKVNELYLKAKYGITSFMTKESGEINMIAILVLIGVVIVVAGVFREQLAEMVEGLFGNLKESANAQIDTGI